MLDGDPGQAGWPCLRPLYRWPCLCPWALGAEPTGRGQASSRSPQSRSSANRLRQLRLA